MKQASATALREGGATAAATVAAGVASRADDEEDDDDVFFCWIAYVVVGKLLRVGASPTPARDTETTR